MPLTLAPSFDRKFGCKGRRCRFVFVFFIFLPIPPLRPKPLDPLIPACFCTFSQVGERLFLQRSFRPQNFGRTSYCFGAFLQ
ncbi:MAG: hypothetical protein A2600_11150 [Candidatus Lambdaproteobacteria bacterium RIFOXYD1_FULL_56_27]|uniref:Uncharacterized protein n=1 Tax=Candidatus Lambdaproteobacteria bacterium RIFOXYD2_FULL_56_26 TaxID=1817773 RepID=A0A1F6GU82_9PROT|nr:MAG: hypothetical protein A2426_09190 [Candidatus Lambdaproteobacteria bacterium RIFOXYC1_FULL_56_13]OGH01717.1 MAG: hypothetical protein A2557_09075 [Candidatus Lambdaproteobacteria bacterium RIFOXYD2_FULL_56_26]OGH07602.1 MAG: hypothetical protein A2600_11150 [Candidatus Lambdaproteobacteria bacterium RIFOXYD1_FULL_56_27]